MYRNVIINILIVLLFTTSCAQYKLQDKWTTDTINLLKMSKIHDIGYYTSLKPDIYETYYNLKIEELYNQTSKPSSELLEFLSVEAERVTTLNDLIVLNKVLHLYGQETILDKIINHPDYHILEKNLNSGNDSEIINGMVMLKYFPEGDIKKPKIFPRKLANKIISSQKLIYTLPILEKNYDIKAIVLASVDKVQNSVTERLKYIFNGDNYINYTETI